jgi:hypothetical protein
VRIVTATARPSILISSGSSTASRSGSLIPEGSRKTEAVTAASGGASVARSSRVMTRP